MCVASDTNPVYFIFRLSYVTTFRVKTVIMLGLLFGTKEWRFGRTIFVGIGYYKAVLAEQIAFVVAGTDLIRSSPQWLSDRSMTTQIVLDLRSLIWGITSQQRLKMCFINIFVNLQPVAWNLKGGLFDPCVGVSEDGGRG